MSDVAKPTEQFRRTSLGLSLQESLDQMIKSGTLPMNVASNVLKNFDIHMAGKLAMASPRMRFSCAKVSNFKEMDKVYNCVLKQCNMNIRGLSHSKDNMTISNVGQLRIEMHPSMGVKKRHGQSIVVVKEKVKVVKEKQHNPPI